MTDSGVQFLDVAEGGAVRRIACCAEPGASPGAPGLFWLSGFKSDMASTKAVAVAAHARALGLASTRFDYSGHGVSSGAFEDGTIGRWLAEAAHVFRRMTRGSQVVIGSSMGGYIALLLLRRLMAEAPPDAARIRALVLIAPAWDMTETLIWQQMSAADRAVLTATGSVPLPSDYGEPYPITRALIEDGRQHLIGGSDFNPERPVLVIQGRHDTAVPVAHARRLVDVLAGGHVEITEIADGDHRLSRPQDLAVLYRLVDRVLAGGAAYLPAL